MINLREVLIREAVEGDARMLANIHNNSTRLKCKGYYTEDQIEQWLVGHTPELYPQAIREHRVYVATLHDLVIGFTIYREGEVEAVYVNPLCTGQGVGRKLLDYCLELADGGRQGSVKVEATRNAVSFYAKAGFEGQGEVLARMWNGSLMPSSGWCARQRL